MEVQCSFCNQPILVEASLAGQVFACPHCGQSLQMAAAAPAPVTPTPVVPAPSVPVATPAALPTGATPVQPIPQNPFAIDKDPPPSRRSSSRRGSDRGSRQSRTKSRKSRRRGRYSKEDSDQTTNLILGVAGASMLLIGFFCPILSSPLFGGWSYLSGLEISNQFGFTAFNFAAWLLLAASIASFIIVATKPCVWLCSTGIGAGIAILITLASYFDMKQTMSAVTDGVYGVPSPILEITKAVVIQLGFGLAIVGVGTGLLFVAAFFPAKQRAN